jgi:carbamoyltransferase
MAREANPRYWQLIKAFEKQTGVPMVVNTSFNDNEPVVNRPEEALDCFLRTEMDAVVLDNFLITKSAKPELSRPAHEDTLASSHRIG